MKELNEGEFTVFVPNDDAWAKVVPAAMTAFSTSSRALTEFLTYHVVSGRLDAGEVIGSHTTLQGGEITVSGSGDELVVQGTGQTPTRPDGTPVANEASVTCGGIHAENATIYLIDSVLTPPVG